ncbi:hypothetical protein, partial [Salmonella enterica]|uniref:hypothetical protein n=1 Tax=Salmonella enterica TaxID=28901 RepID=UPI00195A35D7
PISFLRYKKYDAELTLKRMTPQKINFKTTFKKKKRDIFICDNLHKNCPDPQDTHKYRMIHCATIKT